MKRIFKEKMFWGLVVSAVAAVLFAVLGTMLHPGMESPLKELEKGINERDEERITACYAPENQEELLLELQYRTVDELMGMPDRNSTLQILQAESAEEEDGSKSAKIFAIYKSNQKCVYVDRTAFEIAVIDGENYLVH